MKQKKKIEERYNHHLRLPSKTSFYACGLYEKIMEIIVPLEVKVLINFSQWKILTPEQQVYVHHFSVEAHRPRTHFPSRSSFIQKFLLGEKGFCLLPIKNF